MESAHNLQSMSLYLTVRYCRLQVVLDLELGQMPTCWGSEINKKKINANNEQMGNVTCIIYLYGGPIGYELTSSSKI